MKIGILGGSFNPPHPGHVYISKIAYKKLNLNQIWWLVAKCNPFKSPLSMLDFATRLNLCKVISINEPYIRINDFEQRVRSHETYFVLKKLHENYPNHQFYWLMGSDNLQKLHLWKNAHLIIGLMPIIIFSRNNNFLLTNHYKFSLLYSHQRKTNIILKKSNNWWHIQRIKNKNISSTEIRRRNFYNKSS